MKKNKLWISISILCVIVLGTMVYYSCSRDENKYYQVSYTDIKDWEKDKRKDWSNKDSSVIFYSLFKNLSFLDDYVMNSCIEVRNKQDTLFYLRQTKYNMQEEVTGDGLVVAHQDNYSIGGWWKITPRCQHRLDGDSLEWSQTLKERKDIAAQLVNASELKHAVYKLEKSGLVKVNDDENPLNRQNKKSYDIEGIYYVSPFSFAPVSMYKLDSNSKRLLTDN
ncbi:hypothetical protein [Sphingobacterium anhuiense]|uniref:Lipoprotein n=1 Tax=Sphingobacterium anhuiense TaxID=493780 RepID=A0ABW5YQ55_9SPHI